MNEPKNGPARAYIFTGNDTVGKEAARKRALEAITSANGGVVREHYDPTTEPFEDYIQKALSPTLFGDVRIFSINCAETLSGEQLTLLDNILDHLPDDIYIIIEIGDTGRRKSAKSDPAKLLHADERSKKEGGRFICRDFQKPPEYKVAQWLCENVPELCGRSIDKAAADRLVDLVGYDTATLLSEIGKIDIHLDDGAQIECESVERIAGMSRQMTPFELAAACGARDASRVLRVLESLFSSTCSVPMLISALYRHYGALFRIRQYGRVNPKDINLLLKGGPYQAKNEAAFRIGLGAGLLNEGEERKAYPVIILSGIVPQARDYTDEELRTILHWLLEFDVAVKTGRRPATQREMELFCYKLLRISGLVRSGELR